MAHMDQTSLFALPDELVLRILLFLDLPELQTCLRTSHRLRDLSIDPILHRLRRRTSWDRIDRFLPTRPALATLQPPRAAIYLSRTHVAARRLHWSLVCIRLNRSIARRPDSSALVAANILPEECCTYDRRSGEVRYFYGAGLAGSLIERKRRLEREQIKQGLQVWLERKARQIGLQKQNEGRVGILRWRFSRSATVKVVDGGGNAESQCCPRTDKVSGLKKFWEDFNTELPSRWNGKQTVG